MYKSFYYSGFLLTSDFFSLIRSTQISGDGGLKENPIYAGKEEVQDTSDTFTGGESQPLVSKESSREIPSIVVTSESAVGEDNQPLLSEERPQEKPDNVIPTEDLDDLNDPSSELKKLI